MQVNPRRLYRSRDRQLAGVAGGMAEYLDIDPTIIRVLWILAAILSVGFVILAYIVLAIVMPENPYAAAGPVPGGYQGYGQPGYTGYGQPGYTGYGQPGYTGYGQPGYDQSASASASAAGPGTSGWSAPPPSPAWSPDWATRADADVQARQPSRGRGIGAAAIVGAVLIVIGAIAFADAVLPGWSSAAVLGPAVILALGAALLVASVRRRDDRDAVAATPAAPADGTTGSPGTTAPAGEPAAGTSDPVATDVSTATQPVDPAALS
jgi:phage shock protein PspC (stress-responsive transcriptional regulator)